MPRRLPNGTYWVSHCLVVVVLEISILVKRILCWGIARDCGQDWAPRLAMGGHYSELGEL